MKITLFPNSSFLTISVSVFIVYNVPPNDLAIALRSGSLSHRKLKYIFLSSLRAYWYVTHSLSMPSIGPKYNVVPDRMIISSGVLLDSSMTRTSSSTGSMICAHV